jgi:FtsH-binding integral membrane protein
MRYRKLRVAWSITCSIACVLLIMLLVRSYWWVDNMLLPPSKRTMAISQEGVLVFSSQPVQYDTGYRWLLSFSVDDIPSRIKSAPTSRWGFSSGPFATFLIFPHWFPVLFFATLVAVPWIRQTPKRFSLRTLLIATTLIAMVLGLVVWATRN